MEAHKAVPPGAAGLVSAPNTPFHWNRSDFTYSIGEGCGDSKEFAFCERFTLASPPHIHDHTRK
jgi:hypothetical protein